MLLEDILSVLSLLKLGANSITSVVFVLSRFSSSKLGAPTKLIVKLALLQFDNVTDLRALALDTLNVASLLQLGAYILVNLAHPITLILVRSLRLRKSNSVIQLQLLISTDYNLLHPVKSTLLIKGWSAKVTLSIAEFVKVRVDRAALGNAKDVTQPLDISIVFNLL